MAQSAAIVALDSAALTSACACSVSAFSLSVSFFASAASPLAVVAACSASVAALLAASSSSWVFARSSFVAPSWADRSSTTPFAAVTTWLPVDWVCSTSVCRSSTCFCVVSRSDWIDSAQIRSPAAISTRSAQIQTHGLRFFFSSGALPSVAGSGSGLVVAIW